MCLRLYRHKCAHDCRGARLRDRIDIQIEVPAVSSKDFASADGNRTGSRQLREQVAAARQRQLQRQGGLNCRLPPGDLERFCLLGSAQQVLVAEAGQVGVSGVHDRRAQGVHREPVGPGRQEALVPSGDLPVADLEEGREIVLLTNHLDFGATTISAIYKDRWQIELFFKALKQNLKVKTFVGTTENALYIQIWTALIAILLIKYLQFKSKFGWSLSNLVAFLRWNLFTYRDLWEWIDNPFDILPIQQEPVQYHLLLPGLGQQN